MNATTLIALNNSNDAPPSVGTSYGPSDNSVLRKLYTGYLVLAQYRRMRYLFIRWTVLYYLLSFTMDLIVERYI